MTLSGPKPPGGASTDAACHAFDEVNAGPVRTFEATAGAAPQRHRSGHSSGRSISNDPKSAERTFLPFAAHAALVARSGSNAQEAVLAELGERPRKLPFWRSAAISPSGPFLSVHRTAPNDCFEDQPRTCRNLSSFTLGGEVPGRGVAFGGHRISR